MAELTMPILGADMEAGTLVAWRVGPGDRVERGAIVAEVETEKGIIEIEVFTAGTVERLLVEPGTKVPVGTPLATIREDRAAAPTVAAPPSAAPPRPPARSPGAAPPPSRARVSPAARRRAHELGIDATALVGTGPNGAVTLDDVERAATESVPPPSEVPAMFPMRRAIAAAMGRSKREIPHFYLGTTIPLGTALGWLERENAARPVTDRLLPGVLLVKAVALALRAFPELNARWSAEGPVAQPAINVGVAISLRDGGLVAPAVQATDTLALPELMRRFRDLVARARSGGLRGSELSESTITVTSLGDQGVEQVTGVIFPPQVAIVGFGKIVERPWVAGGTVVPTPVVTVTLAADHRVTDGHRAARFLVALEGLLQRPDDL